MIHRWAICVLALVGFVTAHATSAIADLEPKKDYMEMFQYWNFICDDRDSAQTVAKSQGDFYSNKITLDVASKNIADQHCKRYEGDVPFYELKPFVTFEAPVDKFFAAENDGKFFAYRSKMIRKGWVFDSCDTLVNAILSLRTRGQSYEPLNTSLVDVYSAKHCVAGTVSKDQAVFIAMWYDTFFPERIVGGRKKSSVKHHYWLGQTIVKDKIVYFVAGYS